MMIFSKKKPNDRSTAEEIFEGVIFAAQREHEEKKLKFLGNLFANLAFNPQFDRTQSNLLIKIAQRCSYRQLCLLALFNEKRPTLRKEPYEKEPGQVILGQNLIPLLTELIELCTQGLIFRGNNMVSYLGAIAPAEMKSGGGGPVLYRMMELWDIDQNDVNEIAKILE